MFDSIKRDLMFHLRHGDMVIKLILINACVFVVLLIVRLIFFIGNAGVVPAFYQQLIDFLSLSNEWQKIVFRPWTLVSHMFLHTAFLHILFNMLYLLWFGRVLENLLGGRKIINIYFFGGLGGALFYFIFSKFLYAGMTYAMGASAAVMAVAVAAATMVPDHEFRLLFIGNVKLKYLVLVLLLIDLLMIPGMRNSGGHVAHLGGALMGFVYIKMLYGGIDIGDIRWKPKVRKRPRFKVFVNKDKAVNTPSKKINLSEQQKVDAILDKIKTEGYENLSQEEKDFLFDISKK